MKCKFCNFITDRSSNLKTHLSKKKRCNPDISEEDFNEFVDYINNTFKRIKKTKVENTLKVEVTNNGQTNILTNVNNSTITIDNSKTENITNITNNYFVLMPYDKPNLSYIKEAHIKNFLKSPPNALVELVRHIHYNKDRKENWNIFAPGKTPDYGYLQVWDGESWIYLNKKELILKLIDDYNQILNDYIDAHPDEFNFDENVKNGKHQSLKNFVTGLSEGKKLDSIYNKVKTIVYNECRKLGINPKLTLTVTLEN